MKALRISPQEIQTSAAPADVTLSFTITDDASGVIYFEAVFPDPSGMDRRSASIKFNPTRSLNDSTKITFPRFSNGGDWELNPRVHQRRFRKYIALDTDALRRGGFPTQLTVKSAKDTVSPKLTALNYSPAEVDTSTGPRVLEVNYTATDDLSGVNCIEMSFASPSGSFKNVSTKFEAAESVSNSLAVTFPALRAGPMDPEHTVPGRCRRPHAGAGRRWFGRLGIPDCFRGEVVVAGHQKSRVGVGSFFTGSNRYQPGRGNRNGGIQGVDASPG